ncbi:ATP-binding protein [Pulveribacter suum]|uniref:Histidine kinase n=1 Tax=Pulveribacter suum TaxID=2116657 RepID=A0A2P1NJF2_9BURK|nr:ATP-binding protein [Pulveribacter suum]AVP57208.1 histidine kinase [Pulveribacter suum]
MEVIRGWSHRSFQITDPSCVGEARRFCAKAVQHWGWADADAGRLALIVTELGTNLQRHAKGGALWIAIKEQLREVEVLALDNGPGIADVTRALQDGVSTGSGSPGTGLGGIRRLADDFDLYSAANGTLCLARVRASGQATVGCPAVGAVSLCAPGEIVCGDAWAFAQGDAGEVALLVADGLGHGVHAAEAAQAAVDVFAQAPFASLEASMHETHAALQTTRGAALFLLRLEAPTQVRHTGAGNVLGRLLSGVADRTLLTQHGTAGVQVRRPEISCTELPAHGVAVLYSDGVISRWKSDELHPLLSRDPALLAAAICWRHGRGRDDATVVVFKPGDGLD